jgi:hypothetical protein
MNMFKITLLTLLAAATAGLADVSVQFANSLPVTTKAGNISLAFAVDSVGGVTLDASTDSADSTVIAAVDAWDGSVGTVSYAPAFSTTFSIAVTGSGAMRLTNLGGLGVEGVNQNRLDNPGVESIFATPDITGSMLSIKSVDWASRANTTVDMTLGHSDGSAVYSLPTAAGTWDVSSSNVVVIGGEDLTFGNEDLGDLGDGYVLSGFSFDLDAEIQIPGIAVSFANSLSADPATVTNMPISIMLDFTVDGDGYVTLDASCEETNAALTAVVDAWDGPAGYLDYTNNVSFRVVVDASGGDMRLSGWGGTGGLGVTGQTQWRVDRTTESIAVTLESLPGVALKMKNIEWTSRTAAGAAMLLDASSGSFTNELSSLDGIWSLEEDVLANNDDYLTIGVANTNLGYTLTGFEFVLTDQYQEPNVIHVAFSYDGGNVAQNQDVILDFAIDSAGIVSLDASTTSTDATATNAVNGWDSDNVGYVTISNLFGKTFTLTADAKNELGDVPLTIWSNDGGLVAVLGQNSGRIDGAGLATNNLETLSWTLTGGAALDFQSFSFANAHTANGGLKLLDEDTTVLYDLSGGSTYGDQDISADGFSLAPGEALVFSGDTNYVDGAGIAGFSFIIGESGLTVYETWVAGWGEDIGGNTNDYDGDLLSNIHEYGVGGDPTDPSDIGNEPVFTYTGTGFEYVHVMRNDDDSLTYYLQTTDDLVDGLWDSVGYTVDGTNAATAGDFDDVTNSIPMAGDRLFIRLVVE